MAMIWSNRVAGSVASARAAAGDTRSVRPRISATMIALPSPFIFANCAASAMKSPLARDMRAIWRMNGKITSRQPEEDSGDGDDSENGEQEQDAHDRDADLRAGERCTREPVEPKQAGHRGDDEQDENPFEHRNDLSREQRRRVTPHSAREFRVARMQRWNKNRYGN